MKNLIVGILAIPAISVALSASALDTDNCSRPENPVVPDSNSATESDLLGAQAEIKGYNSAAEKYLECLKGLETRFTEATPEDDKNQLVVLYNGMVDDMHNVADKFNQAVRAYKARAK